MKYFMFALYDLLLSFTILFPRTFRMSGSTFDITFVLIFDEPLLLTSLLLFRCRNGQKLDPIF